MCTSEGTIKTIAIDIVLGLSCAAISFIIISIIEISSTLNVELLAKFQITIFAFILPYLAKITLLLRNINTDVELKVDMIRNHNELHTSLVEIYNNFAKIQNLENRSKKLFIDYFKKEANIVCSSIHDAVHKEIFKGNIPFIFDEKEKIQELFENSASKTWKMTWALDQEDVAWTTYFKYGLSILNNKIDAIHIIFIHKDAQVNQSAKEEYEQYAKIAENHNKKNGSLSISRKFISRARYESHFPSSSNDEFLDHYDLDIYGDSFILVYEKRESSRATHIINKSSITLYTNFFDKIFEQAAEDNLPPGIPRT